MKNAIRVLVFKGITFMNEAALKAYPWIIPSTIAPSDMAFAASAIASICRQSISCCPRAAVALSGIHRM